LRWLTTAMSPSPAAASSTSATDLFRPRSAAWPSPEEDRVAGARDPHLLGTCPALVRLSLCHGLRSSRPPYSRRFPLLATAGGAALFRRRARGLQGGGTGGRMRPSREREESWLVRGTGRRRLWGRGSAVDLPRRRSPSGPRRSSKPLKGDRAGEGARGAPAGPDLYASGFNVSSGGIRGPTGWRR